MDIVCCIKSVPNVADEELRVEKQRVCLEGYSRVLNECDRYVLEEALRLTELHGGSVTALTLGDAECEDALRRALALGAQQAVHLAGSMDEEPRQVASRLAAAIRTRPFDLVLTGAQSSDRQGAAIGGMIAALLGVPFVSLVLAIERQENNLVVQREVEGGALEIYEIELPAVLSLQTGINTPRYVSMRGIRKAAAQTIPVLPPEPAAPDREVRLVEHRHPPAGAGARILRGDLDAMAREVADLIRERGGL
jgi:electron transfer flavoprotein beta subunit